MPRTRNLFDPAAVDPYRISRSGLELFHECPRCFYFDKRLGHARPPGFPFNLNSAVDTLLKREFDGYRRQRKPHPLIRKAGVKAIPFSHPDLEKWRTNFTGVQVLHHPTNLLVTGAVAAIALTQPESGGPKVRAVTGDDASQAIQSMRDLVDSNTR